MNVGDGAVVSLISTEIFCSNVPVPFTVVIVML